MSINPSITNYWDNQGIQVLHPGPETSFEKSFLQSEGPFSSKIPQVIEKNIDVTAEDSDAESESLPKKSPLKVPVLPGDPFSHYLLLREIMEKETPPNSQPEVSKHPIAQPYVPLSYSPKAVKKRLLQKHPKREIYLANSPKSADFVPLNVSLTEPLLGERTSSCRHLLKRIFRCCFNY